MSCCSSEYIRLLIAIHCDTRCIDTLKIASIPVSLSCILRYGDASMYHPISNRKTCVTSTGIDNIKNTDVGVILIYSVQPYYNVCMVISTIAVSIVIFTIMNTMT